MPLNGERAYQLMQGRGVDALVASSTENVYYVSDYWSLGKRLGCGVQAYAILPMKGDPAIVAHLDEADLILDRGTTVGDIHFYGASEVELGQPEEPSEQTKGLLEIYKAARPEADGVSALVKALSEKGLARGVVAIDTTGLGPSLYEHIRGKLPDAKIVDGADLLQKIRLVKTAPELERVRRATEITEKSMEDALEIARTEITELDLAGMFEYSVAYDGGQVTQNLIGFRDRSAFPNPVPSDIEAQRRDLMRLTLGCTWGHYHSNISRTAVIGPPNAKVKKRWEAVQSAQDALISAVKPGVKLSEVYAAAEKALRGADIKRQIPIMGHGLGVECNERPWIEKGCEDELIEGMVINVDVPVLELGWGGIQLEDTVLVTADGCELLTRTDRTLYLL
jgi:Xaa-Pro aminopeptidase